MSPLEPGAPHLSEDEIEWAVAQELYHVFPGTTLTVCCLVMVNGFKVLGQSASISLAAFDEELGRRYARRDALENALPFMAFLLMHDLYQATNDRADRQAQAGQ